MVGGEGERDGAELCLEFGGLGIRPVWKIVNTVRYGK